MASEIKMVAISHIKPNPMRKPGKYPFDKHKLGTLRRSYRDVGMWPGVIGRKVVGGVEIAFGHHRTEAAREEYGGDHKIPIIIEDLDDRQMVQYFGRENLEDYNASFMVMQESWDGAKQFLRRESSRGPANNSEDLEIAQLLGWTRPDEKGKSGNRINDVASACANASRLIQGGYMAPEDLHGLAVNSVLQLVGRVISQHEMAEKMGKVTNRPPRDVEKVKKMTGRAGKVVARQIREGRVANKDIRGRVDVESFRATREAKQTPLFKAFASRLIDQIGKVAKDDAMAERFHEIQKALPTLSFEEDVAIVKHVGFACGQASERFAKWQKAFTEPQRRVVKLKEIAHDR